jgi:hypothetical protein
VRPAVYAVSDGQSISKRLFSRRQAKRNGTNLLQSATGPGQHTGQVRTKDIIKQLQKPQPAGRLWGVEIPNGRYNVFAVVHWSR